MTAPTMSHEYADGTDADERAQRQAGLIDRPNPFRGASPPPITDPDGHAVYSTPTEAAARVIPRSSPLPEDSTERKGIPLWEGVMAYFPAALIAAARVSQLGNAKHNPGEPLHHARGKSMDHTDCLARHLVDYQAEKAAGGPGWAGDGWSACQDVAAEHLGNLVWRVLAYAQVELEEMGRAPLPPRARRAQGGVL